MSQDKIKLVVSDFHMGAGPRNKDGSINYLEDFVHDDKFVEFLEYYSSGDYENSEVELIINGDFFNLIQIDYEEADPDIVTEVTALRRMRKIMDSHNDAMTALKKFEALSDKSITFIMGNHDPGILFLSVQELIREYCGQGVKFLLETYEFDGVYIEHGHQYDVSNKLDKDCYFLTENVSQPVLNQSWGNMFVIYVINEFKKIYRHRTGDKVLPFQHYVKWIFAYNLRFVARIFFRWILFCIKSWLRSDPRRKHSFMDTVKILKDAAAFPDLDRAAEKILLSRGDVHTVIFGHNHIPAYHQFAPDKEYINTGTWNEMTNLSIERFGTQLLCTFALIEYEGQRAQTTLKVWRGHRQHCAELNAA